MAKKPSKHRHPWTPNEVNQLEELARKNTPTPVIAMKLGRSEDAVRSKAQRDSISLKPVNQSPYNRRKK